jgi:fatty acyl-CoA reductase
LAAANRHNWLLSINPVHLFQAFVHVSTAFNNLDREKIKEEVYYNPKVNPVKLIEFLDGLDDETLKVMTPE